MHPLWLVLVVVAMAPVCAVAILGALWASRRPVLVVVQPDEWWTGGVEEVPDDDDWAAALDEWKHAGT